MRENKIASLLCIIVVMIVYLSFPTKCHAQTDTIPCRVECIKKYTLQQTSKGTDRIYMLYSDEENDIQDLIYVPKTTYDYIEMCQKNKIAPQIGIRFRNGQITSIVRYKRRYKINK